MQTGKNIILHNNYYDSKINKNNLILLDIGLKLKVIALI